MQSRQDYFKNYPGVNEFHFTSDGTAFFTEADAKSHAASLEDKKVESVKREDIEAEGKEAKAKK